MKHCTLVSVLACLLAAPLHAYSTLRRLRLQKVASQTASGSPIADNLWTSLHRFKWTVFLGDSVLGAQFMTMAQELGATPDEPGLSQHGNCTEKGVDGAWPTMDAMLGLMDEPFEYLLLCGSQGCKFSRLGCMNFYGSICTDKDHCVEACEGTAVWDSMIKRVTKTISQDGGFAVSFHWAPSYFPHTNVYDRLGRFVPGALLWNNCHHWIGHGQPVAEPVKLNIWLSYVDESAVMLKKIMGSHTVAYQGCTRVLCEGGARVAEDHDSEWVEQCKGRRQWLQKANVAAQRVIVGHGMTFIDLTTLLPDDVLRVAFLDGAHPCMPIPCMWQSSQVHPPRQCCQSLVMHSLHSLGGLQGSGNNSWEVPTLPITSGKGNSLVKSLVEDVFVRWDEASPKEPEVHLGYQSKNQSL